MPVTNEYELQALNLLATMGVTFTATLLGSSCPHGCTDSGHTPIDLTFPRKTHLHGKHYGITLTRTATGKLVGFDFWNSYSDEEFNWLIQFRNADDMQSKFTHFKKWEFYDKLIRSHGFKNGRIIDIRNKNMRPTRRIPTAYDVLACLTKSHPGTFEEFCSGYGYDSDSRKAFTTYQAVLEEYGKLASFFTTAELEQLQGIA